MALLHLVHVKIYSLAVSVFSCCITTCQKPCGCSVAKSCLTLCNSMDYSMPGFPVLHHLPEFPETHVHWVDDVIQPSHAQSPHSPSAVSISQHQDIFQWVSSSNWWSKYWSLSFSISPSNEYSGLISLRTDWFDLFAVEKDSQDSSPAPQFESINFLVLRASGQKSFSGALGLNFVCPLRFSI